MLAPERRTRADLIVAAALAVAIVVAASVVWLRSDARGTTSITWDGPVAVPAAATTVPATLTEVWRATSAATTRPLAVGGTVATADAGSVVGRDLETGARHWSYQRNMPLCAAASAWQTIIAVYRDRRGCGQVTQLTAADGARGAQRTSDADDAIVLVDAGTHLISAGDTRLEMWRSDLVRTVEYGRVDAAVNPNAQPRTGCTLLSAGASATRLAVVERCRGEAADRLTLLDPVPDDNQKPEEFASSVLAESAAGTMGTRVVAVAGDRTALYLPPGDGTGPRIQVFGEAGQATAEYPLPHPATDAATVPAKSRDGIVTWWTGTDTVALGSADLAPRWTVPDTIGWGDAMAGALLLPVDDALAVVDPATGTVQGRIPVDRDETGPIAVTVAGSTVLEQRGDEVVALR
ncbi:Rv3212 family protein [Rhodococcus zopfii]